MAKIQVRHPLRGSYLQPIKSNFAVDVRSIHGLLTPSCGVNLSAISAVDSALNFIPGIRVRELKLEYLMLPAYFSNGIYFFYDTSNVIAKYNKEVILNNSQKVVYVGKASGRTFIERIAAHFPSRDNDYMNNMLKNLAQITYYGKSDTEIDKVFPIVKEFYLKIIFFPACCSKIDICIGQLEKELIKYYNRPLLNKR
jgi:hypothetical protein